MTDQQRRDNFRRNCPGLYALYVKLPHYHEGMAVRCPTKNLDGSDIAPDDVRGCGSERVTWDGEMYDCKECSIFFNDYAADPPHQRPYSDAGDLPAV
jgi:hypothetical protein